MTSVDAPRTQMPPTGPGRDSLPIHGVQIRYSDRGRFSSIHAGARVWMEPGRVGNSGTKGRDWSGPVGLWKEGLFGRRTQLATIEAMPHPQRGTDPREQAFRDAIIASGLLREEPSGPAAPGDHDRTVFEMTLWHDPTPSVSTDPDMRWTSYRLQQGETPTAAMRKVTSAFRDYVNGLAAEWKDEHMAELILEHVNLPEG